MLPSTETDGYLEYEGPGLIYRVYKTNPPSFEVIFDYSHAKYADKPQTWAEIKLLFDDIKSLD